MLTMAPALITPPEMITSFFEKMLTMAPRCISVPADISTSELASKVVSESHEKTKSPKDLLRSIDFPILMLLANIYIFFLNICHFVAIMGKNKEYYCENKA